MRLHAARIIPAGGVAWLSLSAGCVSPPDPYGGERPTQPPAAVVNRTAWQEAAKPAAPAPTPEVAPASAWIPSVAPPPSFTPDEAVKFALRNNPTLHSVRLQRGLAEGGVVIARTYPFNPIAENYGQGDSGPRSAGITNHFFFQTTIRLDLELMGQGKHRRSAAEAVVSRTEWEIATQEVQVSIATARAVNTVLYRKRKLEVQEDTVKLSQVVADIVKKLVDAGRLRPADLIVARTEIDGARALIGSGRVALVAARAELQRQLGSLDPAFDVTGELDLPLPTLDLETYAKAALDVRPDVQARRAAVAEAESRLRLTVADRFGNISVGPSYQVDDNSTNYIGVAVFAPIPVLNTHQGEIMQAKATVARSQADVRQVEVQAQQEVQSALIRLAEARKWAESYANEVLPNLRKSNQDMERLLQQNDPGVDVIKVIDVQRNYLRAFDSYLDALYEVSQARADLAAAVGDPALALGLYAPLPPAEKAPAK
jgi:cobalt-zinc-cadmium efflux system outer membrane protein